MALIGIGLLSHTSGRASGAGGDFHLDFIGAHQDTYDHQTGVEVSPGSLQFDGRNMQEHTREELEAVDFRCDDRIVFFTAVTVDDSAAQDDQEIVITYWFDARNNGQQAVGYSEVVATGVSYADFPSSQTEESGNKTLDGDESASLVSEQYLAKPKNKPSGTAPTDFGNEDADILEAVVDVGGLDPGEQLIVRIDVRFSCFGDDPTGNLHAALASAETSEGDRVNVGQQDIPMLGLGELSPPTPTPTPAPPPSPTPSPAESPTPSPAESPTPSPAESPMPSPEASPTPSPEASPTPSPAESPTPSPEASPTPSPEASPTPSPEASPTPSPEASPTPSPEASPTPSPEASPTPSPEASPTPSPEASPTPSPEASPTPSPEASPTPSPEASPTPSPEASPTPTAPPAVAGEVLGPESLPAAGAGTVGIVGYWQQLALLVGGAVLALGVAMMLAAADRNRR